MTFIVFKEENAKLVRSALEQQGAKILFENLMGRRNFVFPIKKERGGFYINLYFTIEPAKLASLDKILRTEREIARYLIIKNEENIDNIKAKIERMKQKKDTKKMPFRENAKKGTKYVIKETKGIEEVKKDVIVKENLLEKTPAAIEIKATEKDIKTTKKSEKIQKPVAKVKKDKKVEVKPEKSADDQDRIKKLEEKLDELLKD